RHLIRWRALRVNIPVALCEDPKRTLDEKQAWLADWTAERLAPREVRLFEEATGLFYEGRGRRPGRGGGPGGVYLHPLRRSRPLRRARRAQVRRPPRPRAAAG